MKKAQDGEVLSPYMQKRAAQDKVKAENIRKRDSVLNRNANARGMTRAQVREQQSKDSKKEDVPLEGLKRCAKETVGCSGSQRENEKRKKIERERKNGGTMKKAQAGGVVKTTKRVGPVDPNGAFTKVQERTIAGKKGPKVALRKDKMQGATKKK